MQISIPVTLASIQNLKLYDTLKISGVIFTGRDAVLPRLVELIELGFLAEYGLDLEGGAIFHTAVSLAGIGPTSSNKLEIEESIPRISEAGIRIHIGKGCLSHKTTEALRKYHSIFAVTPPVTALLSASVQKTEVVAFPEFGIEALHRITVKDFPAIVAIANGESIFEMKWCKS